MRDGSSSAKREQSLSELHADVRNLSVQEKLLRGKLKPHDWLTDLDLKEAIIALGLKSHILITRLDSENIGTELHFARIAHRGDTPKVPYTITLLLNKGDSGDVSSQGAHWVEAQFHIDPTQTPTAIRITYSDSLSASTTPTEQLQQLLTDAIHYQERDKASGNVVFTAFPSSTATFHFSSGKQRDSWSCGYRALKQAVIDTQNKANDKAQPIINSPDTSDAIADTVLNLLISNKILTQTDLSRLNLVENDARLRAVQGGFSLRPDFVEQYLAALKIPDSDTARLDPTAIKERLEFEKKVSEKQLELAAQFVISNQEARVQTIESRPDTIIQVMKTLTLDAAILFPENTDEIESKIIISALVKAINQYSIEKTEPVKQLIIKNAHRIPHKNSELFEKLTTLVKFELEDGADPAVIKTLTETVARNQLMQQLNMTINPEEAVWDQYYRLYLSDPNLFGRSYNQDASLNIYSQGAVDSKISSFQNDLLLEAGDKPLTALLTFLVTHQNFFESHPTQLPYTELSVGISYYSFYYRAANNIDTVGIVSDSLTALTKHLEAGHYFPFETLSLYLPFDQKDIAGIFEKVLRVFETLEKYPQVKQVQLKSINNGSACAINFTKEQYERLKEIYLRKKLTVQLMLLDSEQRRLDSSMPMFGKQTEQQAQEKKELVSAKYALMNLICQNVRAKHIKNRTEKSRPAKAPLEKIGATQAIAPTPLNGNVRACKLSGFDVHANLSLEISAEQQYQQQTQLQQETQQETQVQAQQNNEVNTQLGGAAKTLISKEQYVSISVSAAQLLFYSFLGKCDSIDGTALSMMGTDDTTNEGSQQILRHWWESFFAQAPLQNSIQYITVEAHSKVHDMPQHFWGGLNFNNLPAGFFIQQYSNAAGNTQFVLHYDATRFIENKNESPLTPLLKSRPKRSEWSGDYQQFFPDEKDKKAIMSFGGFLNDYYSLTFARSKEDMRDQLFKIMDALNSNLSKKIQEKYEGFLLESARKDDLFSTEELVPLFDIVYHKGCEGLDDFLNALLVLHEKNPDLYRHFKQHFIATKKDDRGYILIPTAIMELMTDDSLSIISKLANLTSIEIIWWKKIVESQLETVGYLDLAQLYKGFTYFLSQLPQQINLPTICPIEGHNPLVQLDRLLAILGNVPAHNLEDQFENLNHINLNSEGASYATQWDGYHFVHPKMKLAGEFAEQPAQNFRVSYARLCELSNDSSVDYAAAEIAFHRFVGRADKIAAPYKNYVDLTEKLGNNNSIPDSLKIKLLPLLGIATTGLRGCRGFDAEELMTFVAAHSHDLQLTQTLDRISAHLNTLPEKPTIFELTGLIQLIYESSDSSNAALILLSDVDAERILESWALWQKHSNHLKSDDFVALYSELKSLFPDELSNLSRIAAILKGNCDSKKIKELAVALDAAKKNAYLPAILKIIAVLDIEKTGENNLPTIDQLIIFFSALADKTFNNANEAYLFLGKHFPSCQFNRAAAEGSPVIGFDGQLLEKIESFNADLKKQGFEPFDLDKTKDPATGIDYIVSHYENLINKISTFLHPIVKKSASEFFKSMLLMPLATCISAWRDLDLLKNNYSKEPSVTGEPAALKKELVELQAYATSLENLFTVLIHLHKKWGDFFKLDFLSNSALGTQYTLKDLTLIFKSIHDLNLNFIPTQLLNAIFPEKGLLPSDTNTHDLALTIADIVTIDTLSIKQKSQLITLIYQNSHSADFIKTLTNGLQIVKKELPAASDAVFEIWLHELEANPHKKIIEDTLKLIEIVGKDNTTISSLIFNCFSARNPELLIDYKKLLIAVIAITDPDKQKKFLTIIAQGALQFDYDVTHSSTRDRIFGATGLISKLDSATIDRISVFYDKIPRPTLDRLLQLIDSKINSKSYEKDPTGARLRTDALTQQFNIDTIHRRIDGMLDLGRNRTADKPVALFHNDREKLYTAVAYVTAVGNQYALSIPNAPDALKECRLPVKELSADQIRQLILHYRTIISGKINASEKEIWVAQCELVALLREALYRTQIVKDEKGALSGKMAYDTQILSVLNMMLHGGNIFSEIRTGEGKSIITAMMAACKWAEGGAVDICSSNMALAKRDLAENKDFFDYLGITTTILRASTPHETYQQEGINYSDISELTLWHERQLLEGRELPEKVSLVCDEVDFTTLDNTTQFRYAISLDSGFDPHYNPHELLYPHILHFVQSDRFFVKDETGNPCSAKQDIVNLRNYIQTLPDSIITNKLKAQLIQLPDTLLNRWIDSAYIAAHLREDEDYVIREGVIIKNEEEIKVSLAQVKINFRASPDSRFSDGVHQFLHTLLNERMKKDAHFSAKCAGNAFVIEPEKTFLASRSSKNTLDYYLRAAESGKQRGDIIGLTGTIGTAEDRKELTQNYNVQFFRIPPHKPLRREQQAVVVAKKGFFSRATDQDVHFDAILKSIQIARKNNQSILIICDSVNASSALHVYLKSKLGDKKLQLHNGEQANQDEATVIKKAGENSMVTISTPLFGRGTDIKPKGKNGLHVITTYISAEREYGQNIGRAARNGAIGTDQLIISDAEFKKYTQKVPSNPGAIQSAIQLIRDQLDQEKGNDRYERQCIADISDQFLLQFTTLCREFKKTMTKDFEKIGRLPDLKALSFQNHVEWNGFLEAFTTKKNALMTDFQNQLHEKKKGSTATKADIKKFERAALDAVILKLTQFANAEWRTTVDTIQARSTQYHDTAFQAADAAHKIQNPSDESEEIRITPLKFSPENVASLPALRKIMQPLTMSLRADHLAAPLSASDTKPLEAYLMASNDDPQLKNKLITAQLKKINSALKTKNSSIEKTVRTLLAAHYRLAKLNGVTFAYSNELIALAKVIAAHGTPEQKNELIVALDAHRKAVTEDRKNNQRGQYLLSLNIIDRELSTLQFKASMTEPDDRAAWRKTRELAIKQLEDYLGATSFFRASDRTDIAKKLLIDIRAIDENGFGHSSKLNDLMSLLTAASKSMAIMDLQVDQTRFFRAARNQTGSRLATIINNISSFIGAHQKPDNAPINDINAIVSIINTRAKNLGLPADFYELKSGEQWLESLSLLRSQLQSRFKLSYQTTEITDKERAFQSLLKSTYTQVNSLLLSSVHDSSFNRIELREKIQLGLSELKNPRARLFEHHGINAVERYEDLLKIYTPKQKSLLSKIMFEIEHQVTLAYPGTSDFKFTSDFSEGNLTKITFNATFKFDKKEMDFSLLVNNVLTPESILCHAPSIKSHDGDAPEEKSAITPRQ